MLPFLEEAILVAQLVKNPPAMGETWVQPLGWEDRLEMEMATHSSILAWRIPQTEEPSGLMSIWSHRVGHKWSDFRLKSSSGNSIWWGFPYSSVGKESVCNARDLGSIPGSRRSPGDGNGNPLQYSCVENPMDRGAWQAKIHGVPKSWTHLKRLSILPCEV